LQVTEGREALAKADLIPDGVYTLNITDVEDVPMKKYGGKIGSVAKVRINEADDAENDVPEVIGRTFNYWLVGANSRNLRMLLQHLDLEEVPGGDTLNLKGTTFKGRVSSWKNDKGEWQNQVRPS
jgi:hypothetical protein